ncbi:MAG TPA: hypothetical protein VE870_06140 [Bacteroidales bacterium]|nr:hypothetical protein [Bacteroidales bacterium]
MTFQEKTEAFITLGKFFAQFRTASFNENTELEELNNQFKERFDRLILTEENHNPWFTPENIRFSLGSFADALQKDKLGKWISHYPALASAPAQRLNIGVIMAGNIPMVGFHDFLTVLISGHRLVAKLSSKDEHMLPAVWDVLVWLNHDFNGLVAFEEGRLKNPDAIIATGSNNSSRYFEYYFGKYPHIIRKNRNSAAVLDGSETASDLEHLAGDIFTYFGLGCRNVSKIYIPADYEIPHLLDHFQHYAYLANHHKYVNNYEYYRAIHLVNQTPFLDTGFLVVKEDRNYSSPVGTIHYERYTKKEQVVDRLHQDQDQLQCTVAKNLDNTLDFGMTQSPMLWEYADNVDTLKFLLNLSTKTGHGL